jgi:rare lipoprotein A
VGTPLVAVSLLLAGCAGGGNVNYSQKMVADGEPIPKGGGTYKVGNPYTINGRTYHPTANNSYRAEGIASWYGPDFHGRKTANGEVYDMHALSAAHPTMPMPSYARVTNLENGKSIIVRVNDRGPYAKNRIVDLSIGTAKALGFYGRGLARVRVEYVGPAALAGSDDRMLMATLREGSPAPAPSLVRVASARPLLAEPADRNTLPARPPYRPATLASARSGAIDPPGSPAAVRSTAAPAPSYDSSALGLMSGRGLY